MTQWNDKLQPSEANFVQSIVDQIPEVAGARDAFVSILNKLAEGDAPKFRYFIVSDGDVEGTNDRDKAREQALDTDISVIDSKENLWLMGEEDDGDDTEITEAR